MAAAALPDQACGAPGVSLCGVMPANLIPPGIRRVQECDKYSCPCLGQLAQSYLLNKVLVNLPFQRSLSSTG